MRVLALSTPQGAPARPGGAGQGRPGQGRGLLPRVGGAPRAGGEAHEHQLGPAGGRPLLGLRPAHGRSGDPTQDTHAEARHACLRLPTDPPLAAPRHTSHIQTPETPAPPRRRQIRQLLFPDAEAGGVRVFKADNPDYEAGIREGWKPKPTRFIDMELHGVWGRGVRGKLQVGGGAAAWRAGCAGGRGGCCLAACVGASPLPVSNNTLWPCQDCKTPPIPLKARPHPSRPAALRPPNRWR